MVNEVVELVNSLPSSTVEAPGAFPIPDRPRVISIFGGRGTGKSTALYFAAHALRAETNFLVLPVIDPESFALGDSLGGWVLASLERALTTEDRVKETDSEQGQTLEQMLEDLRRAQAVRAAAYLPGLGNRGLNFDDFARDAVKIPSHGVRMAERFANLLDHLADARKAQDLRLIVPVDDADLFPELLPGIVGDAQMLGSSSRVTVMFAADPRTLAQAMQIAYIANHDGAGVAIALTHRLIEPQDVRELAGRKLIKYFPRSHRVRLPFMTLEQRVNFTPLGQDDSGTLLEIFDRLPLKDGSERSLADLFIIRSESGDQVDVSPYVTALSGNARDMRQLHEAIGILDPSSPNAASRALALIMEHGLDGLESDLPAQALRAISLQPPKGQARPAVRFDFREIAFGKSLVSGLLIYGRRVEEEDDGSDDEEPEAGLPLSRTVAIRPLDRDYSVIETEFDPENGGKLPDADEGAREHELPPQFTYLSLLAWEATQGGPENSLFEGRGYFSRFPLAGGQNWEGFVVGESQNESWLYWVVPQWEEYSDYFTYRTGWDHIFAVTKNGLDHYPINNPNLLRIVLLAHLDLVATVQLQRAIPNWIAELTEAGLRELADDWDDRCEAMKNDVAQRLDQARREAEEGDTDRSRGFLTWFMREMPLAATPLLTTADMSEWLIGVWEESAPPRAHRECSARIARMAREHITSYMADGDVALLDMIEPEAGSASVESLKNLLAEVNESMVQREIEATKLLEGQAIEPQLIAELKERGATRETMIALVRAGVGPDQLPIIGEAFPVRDVSPNPGLTPGSQRDNPPGE